MAKLLFTLNANVPAVIDYNYLEYVESSSAYLVTMFHSVLHNQEPKPQGRNMNMSPLTHLRETKLYH